MVKALTVVAALLSISCSAQADLVSDSAPAAWKPYDGARISFDVLRKGKPFGKHIVSFATGANGDLTVTSDVDLKVKIGPFTAFQYQLDSTETWRSERLVALEGKTNDDGDKAFVTAQASGADLVVEGSGYNGVVDGTIIPSSHWNIGEVQSTQMLSTESGEVLEMTVKPMGRETLSIAGETVEANRYLLDSDIDIDLWYDDDGRWIKLSFDARGQTIEYRLSALY